MEEESVLDQLGRYGVVPVIGLDDPAAALPLADALLEGGLPVIEITFRTAAAAEAIRLLARERPSLLVGAGTVLTPANLQAAKENGAVFAVSPGLNPEIVKQARLLRLPFVPGVATATEIEAGLGLGCRWLKFFPAEALGGVPMLEALSPPFKHAGVRFMPTGGVNLANLERYLRLDTVAAVGGSWIAKKGDLAQGHWQEIRKRCRATLEIVAQARR